jgi:hypothetical protein
MNDKIKKCVDLHVGWTEARSKGLDKVAEGLDLDLKDLYSVLTRKEQDDVWDEIKKLYPKKL